MVLISVLESTLNRSPASVMVEQMRKLYMRLYPYMVPDFAHRGDVEEALVEVNAKLLYLQGLIKLHVHGTPSGSVVSTPPLEPITDLTPVVLKPTVGESLVLLVGEPQPTGEGPPALLPSRVGTPMEVLVTPPLGPSDLL